MCGSEERIDAVGQASGDPLWGHQVIYGYFRQLWFWRFRLHVFMKPEPSAMFHDHAWSFVSFPLRPYVERVLNPVTGETTIEVVRRFRLNRRPATHAHKYIGRWSGHYGADGVPTTISGSVVTLALRGRGGRQWNYWRLTSEGPRRYHWKDYLAQIESRMLRRATGGG